MEESGGGAREMELKTEEEDVPSLSEGDPVFVSCLLQPPMPHHDPNYVAIRRLLLHRKAHSLLQRKVTFFLMAGLGFRFSFFSITRRESCEI